MIPEVSIIIPCYNSEDTLDDTLKSVVNQSFSNWEAIIVNDGSTDGTERIALRWVKKDNRIKYYKKENGGLASARNFGIEHTTGQYILPLDSDNRVRPDFIANAIKIFDLRAKVEVIYGNAEFFGDRSGLWKIGAFDKFRLLKQNYIDACALIRKKVFDVVGLYDTALPFQGHEDWEFWLRVMGYGFHFFYLNEITLDYRVSKNSMIKSFDQNMLDANFKYIRSKHFNLYTSGYDELFIEFKKLRKQSQKSIFEILKSKLIG
ncbi:MAG: glycosyltransferase family A protein [Bacteroidota bacterium]